MCIENLSDEMKKDYLLSAKKTLLVSNGVLPFKLNYLLYSKVTFLKQLLSSLS